MTPPLSLLAASDFSPHARHALERAAQLAGAHPGAQLTLTHVISTSMLSRLRAMMRDEAPTMEARVADEAAQSLAQLAAHLRAQHGCAVDTRLSQGSALGVITDLADELQSDLLVMGARGSHFVREFLLGSTTERVVCKIRRPLLAVKQRPQGAYLRVLVPVDFSAHAAAAHTAHRWLPDAEIVLLHAYEVDIDHRFCAGVRLDRHPLRIIQQGLGQRLNCGRERGREKQVLPPRGQIRQHHRQLNGKAQIKQSIRFVQHQTFDRSQRQSVVLQQVEQAPGRGDHHVGPATQPHHLGVDRHAAKHHGQFETGNQLICQTLQHVADLSGQFSRRHQNERTHTTRRRGRVGKQALQQRQDKRGGFARAGLRGGQHIPTAENDRDRRTLDWGGHVQAQFNGRLNEGGEEPESGEWHGVDAG